MDFEISAVTDIGISKDKNQDSYHVRRCDTAQGQVVFAVLCDGMGGLWEGEVASATVVKAFCNWADEELPKLCEKSVMKTHIHGRWLHIVEEYNEKIQLYGEKKGIRLGTTATAILFWGDAYYIMHIGDTRIYEITDKINVLTTDHTFVAREVELGHLSSEQAKADARRHILLQCIGASKEIFPEFITGKIEAGAIYLLCSDGFRHEITSEEILQSFNGEIFQSFNREETQDFGIENLNMQKNERFSAKSGMYFNMKKLVELNKQRKEKDNITVIGIKASAGKTVLEEPFYA